MKYNTITEVVYKSTAHLNALRYLIKWGKGKSPDNYTINMMYNAIKGYNDTLKNEMFLREIKSVVDSSKDYIKIRDDVKKLFYMISDLSSYFEEVNVVESDIGILNKVVNCYNGIVKDLGINL